MLPLEIKKEYDDEAEFIYYNNFLHIELYSRWDGDSEVGFGNRLSMSFSRNEAIKIRNWLNAALSEK